MRGAVLWLFTTIYQGASLDANDAFFPETVICGKKIHNVLITCFKGGSF